ncbi:class I SAM-dependent methyltransferase [Bermanella sp. WJH001]|uniref:class I SAM-dependent methyltransferase n=1 Tax=Bermanella sp. WJH001 TaxID=3048005 RepID=UPI0024BD6E38|nr:50S ribosomal protein L11 methyltransferase [Bermanella sp. WJH001]MDJ1539380.1 50S ribosomal protein L11 methyltransferase [Bermanella sp. WJH001]
MTKIDSLRQQVKRLFNSEITPQLINDVDLRLWLMVPPVDQNFSPAQIEAIWSNMPYWAFVWSSGRALANYVLENPHLVKDKVIADFGAGSGIVALAALKAGAKQAWVVDIDQAALEACEENATLNNQTVLTAKSLDEIEAIDLILVGDVLYDPRNHGLASILFTQETSVIWAESQAQTKLSQYGPVASLDSETVPNIGGFDEHKQIHIYHHGL